MTGRGACPLVRTVDRLKPLCRKALGRPVNEDPATDPTGNTHCGGVAVLP